MAEYGKPVAFRRIGLHGFSHGYGSYGEVKSDNGIGIENIRQTALKLLGVD